MSNFNQDVGKPISKKEEKKVVDRWTKTGMKTKSNFFGALVFKKLLDLPGAVGISIFYGLDDNDNMKPVLFAVDKDGKPIVPSSAKIASTQADAEEDSGGYNASLTCPPYCNP